MSSSAVTAKGRLEARFEALDSEGRAAFVAFVTAGDPNSEQSQQILEALPGAGVDVIELGMPFTDPMADGPAIQASSLRALKAGQTMIKTLAQVKRFRQKDAETPIILMGYYNPIYHYGVDKFLADAVEAGVDGLIVVDLPPEEDDELCLPAQKAGLRFIRLLTPTTDAKRRPMVLRHTSGFLYYVSITGITGAGSARAETIGQALADIRRDTDLPIAVGFGIKTPEQAAEMAQVADGVVIGSAIVSRIADAAEGTGRLSEEALADVIAFTGELAQGVHSVQRGRHG